MPAHPLPRSDGERPKPWTIDFETGSASSPQAAAPFPAATAA